MPKYRSHADRSLRSDSCLSQVMLGSFFSIVLLLGTACQAKFKKNSYPTAKTSNAESAEALGEFTELSTEDRQIIIDRLAETRIMDVYNWINENWFEVSAGFDDSVVAEEAKNSYAELEPALSELADHFETFEDWWVAFSPPAFTGRENEGQTEELELLDILFKPVNKSVLGSNTKLKTDCKAQHDFFNGVVKINATVFASALSTIRTTEGYNAVILNKDLILRYSAQAGYRIDFKLPTESNFYDSKEARDLGTNAYVNECFEMTDTSCSSGCTVQ